MFILFSDFGLTGPYVGQVRAVLHQLAPGRPVVDLFADAPAFDPVSSAYLLAAYISHLPPDSTVLAVVDPGVGSERAALVLNADGKWFVGPDNGLLSILARRAGRAEAWRIATDVCSLSASFHGRDLFAPVAARLALGEPPLGDPFPTEKLVGFDWPDDRAAIIYLDVYGNAMTGLRADRLDDTTKLLVKGRSLDRARTFSDAPVGTAFWYENANGLAEISVNQGHAGKLLGLAIGDPIESIASDD